MSQSIILRQKQQHPILHRRVRCVCSSTVQFKILRTSRRTNDLI